MVDMARLALASLRRPRRDGLPATDIASGDYLDRRRPAHRPATARRPPPDEEPPVTHPEPVPAVAPDAPDAAEQHVYFNELAELFAAFAADTDVIYRPWLEATLPTSGNSAVDLGCGSGRWTGLLTDRYTHVVGVDIADREIDMARVAHPDATFAVRNLLDVTPDRDGLFDLVFSVNTIHHLCDHDRTLPHLRSLAAPGGHVVVIDITDPGGWSTLDYQIRDAFLDAEESYRQRSKDYRVAAKVLELHLHPAWLDHVINDTPLTRPEFHRRYGTAFPGAHFTDLHRVITAMHWTNPG
jgi:trans-aconitate methyltransferase